MKRITLTITAEAPLAIGQRKPGSSVSEAMDYIPGGAIRGAIAAKILEQAGSEPEVSVEGTGDDFYTLFLTDQAAVFQNAYPAIAKVENANNVEDENYEPSLDVRLLPVTALSSKTESGFRPKKGGVFDSLIDGFCARAQGLFYEPNDLAGDRVEPFSGFYSKKGNTYRSHTVSKRLLTRVGINRRRATAQEEMLYSLEVLDEVQGKKHPQPMVYQSSIFVRDDDLAEQLHQFINHNQFRLGGAASRGLGKVAMTASIEAVPLQAAALKQRLAAFNAAIKTRWDLWSIFGAAHRLRELTFFTVTLQSDAVLTEQWLRTMVISETMLRQFVNLNEADDPTLKLQTAYSSYDYRSGWNAAWGLQKDLELVTKMGGVFLFGTEKPDLWYAKLAELERWGVGDRTSEGFGQIKICDEFHLIFREEPV